MMLPSRHLGILLIAIVLAAALLVAGCGGGGGGGAGGSGDRTGATVTGQIRIDAGGDLGPAKQATVRIGDQVALTNDRGEFTIKSVPIGTTAGSVDGFVGDGSNGWYGKKFSLPPLKAGETTNLGTIKVTSNSLPPDPPF